MGARFVHDDARSVLSVRGLSKRYGRHLVLDGVDLEMAPGELVALVGENGAGKTTLVRCVAGTTRPDAGEVLVCGRHISRGHTHFSQDMAVVWQDLALCENLDVVSNLFLGRERSNVLLSETEMHAVATELFDDLGIEIDDLRRRVDRLSGGQRQAVAIARALLSRPRLVILDEPTASLGVTETRTVEQLMRRMRADGVAIVLISHRIEQVFALADRIVVLRHGRVVADTSPIEVHPDDVVSMISGTEAGSSARRHLSQLRSLVDQLAEVEPGASLPLIVSALSSALGVEKICVHLVDHHDPETPSLVRVASVGIENPLLDLTARVPFGSAGAVIGSAAQYGTVVVTESVAHHPAWGPWRAAALASGVASAWAVPIVGTSGVVGVISACAENLGGPRGEQLELASLYANLAAAAIERERLLAEVSQRNRILESLRGMLEPLAGPDHASGALSIALLALARGLGADLVTLVEFADAQTTERLVVETDPDDQTWLRIGAALIGSAAQFTALADSLASGGIAAEHGPTVIDEHTVMIPLHVMGQRLILAAHWNGPDTITDDSLDLLDDAARSLHLAIEREMAEDSQREAAALRRTAELQQEFLSRLSHELRTPLTAIQGYADTLNQSDVSFDDNSQRRFLSRIASESARMARLVGDLLDTSAIETAGLRLNCHWCELPLVLEAAAACVPGSDATVTLSVDEHIPLVWADHDRLEQVFVNLIDNGLRHGGSKVAVHAGAVGDRVAITVLDDGPGFAESLVERAFEPYVRGLTQASGAGLGLTITKAIVEAHDGSVTIRPLRSGGGVVVELPVEPTSSIGAEHRVMAAGE